MIKDIHYNHQTLRILAKIGSITTITSPKHSRSQELIHFCHKMVFAIVLPMNKNAFFFGYLILYDCSGHVEGSCMGINISITSPNCNHQNCRPRCIYQVLKFPNWSPNCYIQVHSFLRLSTAWPSCYMQKNQMLFTYSNNYLNQKLYFSNKLLPLRKEESSWNILCYRKLSNIC